MENTNKLCYMDTDNFTVQIRTKYTYVDIAKNVEISFYTSNYKLHRPSPRGKNKKSNRINSG